MEIIWHFPLFGLFARFPPASVKWPELLQSTNSGWVTLHLDPYLFYLGEIFSQAKSSAQSGHHWKMTKGLRGASSCLEGNYCCSRSTRIPALSHRLTFPLLSSGIRASLAHCTSPCKTIILLVSQFTLATPVATTTSWKGGRPHVLPMAVQGSNPSCKNQRLKSQRGGPVLCTLWQYLGNTPQYSNQWVKAYSSKAESPHSYFTAGLSMPYCAPCSKAQQGSAVWSHRAGRRYRSPRMTHVTHISLGFWILFLLQQNIQLALEQIY